MDAACPNTLGTSVVVVTKDVIRTREVVVRDASEICSNQYEGVLSFCGNHFRVGAFFNFSQLHPVEGPITTIPRFLFTGRFSVVGSINSML